MIYGIGIDIVEIERMRDNIARFGDRFAERILTEAEYAGYSHSSCRASYLARRFAAKEAFSKALGTGISGAVKLRGIAVGHNPAGQPQLELDSAVSNIISMNGILSCHLSLADEKLHAVACVILEK